MGVVIVMSKIFTTLLLAICLVFSLVFVACGKGDPAFSSEESSSRAAESGDVSGGDNSSEPEAEFVPLSKNFNDTLTIFGKKDGAHVYSRLQWEYDDEIDGDTINDAVRDRNMWLFDHYGLTVKYIADTSGNYFITDSVANMIMNGEDTVDIVCDGLTTVASLAGSGFLYPLNDISPNLDLNHSWWDQRVEEALSINNMIHYAAGDILITDDEYTYCLLYNKDLMESHGIYNNFEGRSLYDVVNDGDWTYDALFSTAKQCAGKTSGGDIMTLADTWGYVGDISCLEMMMAGGGYMMVEKNSDDIPELRVTSEYATNLFSTLIDYMNDSSYSKFMERFGVDGYYGEAEKMFGEGRIAFYNVKLAALTTVLRNTESDVAIGVLPMPMASSDQSDYYNAAAPLHFSCVAIPTSVDEDRLDLICAGLEAMGYLGQKSLTKAYIETTLKIKRADQSEDADMIDLILRTRCFDLAQVYGWGGLNSFFNVFAGTSNTAFVSSWDAIAEKANSALEETISYFTN